MAEYIKRGGPRRFGSKPSFGGKPSFGARGGKASFGKKQWADKDSSDGPKTFYKATCTKCGNSCDVPFKPVNGKPVFCRNCFVKTGDTEKSGRAGDKFPRKDFSARRSTNPASESNSGNNDVLKQLEQMNAKLERLIHAVEASTKKQ